MSCSGKRASIFAVARRRAMIRPSPADRPRRQEDVLAGKNQFELASEPLERFRRNLDVLIAADVRFGVAVSGGPDSMALLLLAAAARPGMVEAATVDHALRPESRAEAEMVASLCERLAVPHTILTMEWQDTPETAIQERARIARYGLLGGWLRDKGLKALLTGHHLDDQAETFMMRLMRGAGVKGLAGMRPLAVVPGSGIALLRPLLGWRRSELERVTADAGVEPVADPSNDDSHFERVRVRQALGDADWLDPKGLAMSASNLAQADAALRWAATQEWNRAVNNGGGTIVYRPADAPREIRRRIAGRAILSLATEGQGEIRGPALDRVLGALNTGGKATLRGVLCSGGAEWRFTKAPARRAAG
jgi:tRNA(Ile)-lysidine synthase